MHRLPGRGKPSVYALKTELNAWRLGKSPSPDGPGSLSSLTVAVMPFANLSNQETGACFGQGLVDDLINDLTHLSRLQVTAQRLPVPLGQADGNDPGSRLKRTMLLLGGSVRVVGSHVRVSAHLADATSGYQLWSERYDRELAGDFATQDEIAKSIVEAVKSRLSRGRRHTHERG